MAWLTEEELRNLPNTKVGRFVRVSNLARLYITELVLGDYCRIDDFAILTGKVHVGKHSHIPPFACLYGAEGVYLHDYAGVSPMCQVYSVSDDYKGFFLMGGSIPEKYRGPDRAPVIFNTHAVIGASSIVLPGTVLPEGSTFGAFSLLHANLKLQPWCIHTGIPARPMQPRSRWILEEQKRLEEEEEREFLNEMQLMQQPPE